MLNPIVQYTLSNGMEFMSVPAGKFIMGSNEYYYDRSFEEDDTREKPQHIVDITYTYWMGRFPVTNAQFALFRNFDKGKENHPAVNISWDDAQTYVTWLNKQFLSQLSKGYIFRLPSEAEWEKAARGIKGFIYPWGNEFDRNRCRSDINGNRGTVPVGLYSPQGDSPYGCADMIGHVYEWTRSVWKKYPYYI